MISYASEPWKKKTISSYANRIFGILFLLIIAMSYSFMLTNPKASADPNKPLKEVCSNVIIAGDVNGVGVEKGEIAKKLKDAGVERVISYTHDGRRTDEVLKAIRDVDPANNCFIIEAGSGNIQDNNPEQNRKEIKRMIDKLDPANGPKASKVYWVTPVVANDRDDLSLSTKQYNDDLRDLIKGHDNIKTVNIQDFSLDKSLFETDPEKVNGVGRLMTDAGYRKRADAIVDAMKTDLKKEEPTPSSETPSSSSQNPPPSSGNGENNPPPGNIQPGGGGGDTVPEPDIDTPPEEFKPAAYSPKEFARKARSMTGADDASRYLAIGRWGAPAVPAQVFSPFNTSFIDNMYTSVATWLLGATHFIMSIGYGFISAAFNSEFGNLALMVGDFFYGRFFGMSGGVLNGGNAAAYALISSIMTISFMLAGWRSLSTMSMSPQQRIKSFFTSIAKTTLVMALAVFSGTMSKANSATHKPAEEYINQMAEDLNTGRAPSFTEETNDPKFTDKAPGQTGANPTLEEQEGLIKKLSFAGSESDGRSINNPLSWRPFSLAWFVSLIYEAGKIFSHAVISIITVFINGPIDQVIAAIKSAPGGARLDQPTQCDRYYDAMHYAYAQTEAMRSSPSAAMAIRSFDIIYYDLVYSIYPQAYGDKTESANRAWCWAAEVDAGIHPGEWAMLNRTAGNYGNVFGTGDLLTSDNMTTPTYVSGKHIMSSLNANFTESTSAADGIVVNSAGEWGGDEAQKAGGVRRAQAFMGTGRGANGFSEAKFYHAACVFDAGSTNEPRLSREWKAVLAMGEKANETWLDDASDIKDAAVDFLKSPKDTIKHGAKKVTDAAVDAVTTDDGEADSPDDIKLSKYLGDGDCQAPVLALNTIIQEPDKNKDPEGKWGGFGTVDGSDDDTEAPYARRWNYQPEIKNVAEEGKDFAKTKTAEGLTLGNFESDVPSEKFALNKTTTDENGKEMENTAFKFWKAATGQKDGGYGALITSSGLIILICIAYAIFSLALIIIGFLINVLAAVMFFFVAAVVGLSLLKFAIYGGSRKLG